MLRLWHLVVVALVLMCIGCGGFAGAKDAEVMAPMDMMMEPDATGDRMAMGYGQPGGDDLAPPPPPQPPPPTPAPTATDAGGDVGSGGGVATKATPLLIYTASYTLAVFEAVKVLDGIQALAEKRGGYLVRRSDDTITVRVPSGKFRHALADISKLGDVLHRDESVEDVTEQFYDLQIRLRNARAVRDRLEQLLVEAKDVKEALAVEKELARLTGDIESMEGRLKRLRELIAFSTITVMLQPLPVDKVESNVELPFPWLRDLGLNKLMNL